MEPFKTSPLLTRKRLAGGRLQRPVYIASIGLHVIAFTALFALAPVKPPEEPVDTRPVTVVFYSSLPEAAPVVPPRLPDPPRVKLPQIKKAEPKRVLPPEPAPVTPLKKLEQPVQAPPPPAPPAPAPRPVAPKPRVQTGAFAESAAPTKAPARATRAVEKVGGFEVEATEHRPGTPPAANAVAAGGFDDGAVAADKPAPTARTGTVATAGFGSAEAGARPAGRATGTGTVAAGGFDTHVMEASKARPRARPVGDPETSVEIVSKPKPVYTDEARRLHIEGEVVLEVTFVASGRLTVHRVVSPLGYGLDEAAVEAAKKIQFTPARRNGVPVDHTATLRVLFRLA